MSNEEIRDLVQLVIESGVAEIEVQRGENRVRIRRTLGARHEVTIPASMMGPAPTPMADAIVQTTPAPASSASAGTTGNETIVKSPIVGTYYDAPKPGDPPFVKVGDQVEPGHVLCIIESMKLMNEIEAEIAGTVVAKLMENGRAVEYGEALFTIRPR
ncbi:MAG TPA: acetyl-CoA carboxylase biotin carboxyl carrier protein [Bryobacteraceae bacterium]|nr:acetyl-CoA carboxylase biotin carboxyl carrier protein [Bryobacteraceae bacterium]